MSLEPDDVTLGRMRRFVDERLTPALDAAAVPLNVELWQAPGSWTRGEPPSFTHVAALSAREFVAAPPGTSWGPPWSTAWLKLRGEVPLAWADAGAAGPGASTARASAGASTHDWVDVVVDLGFTGDTPGFQAEGTARTSTGRVIKGIQPFNHHVPLAALLADDPAAADWRAGRAPFPVDLWVEAAANPVLDPDFTFTPTPLGSPATLPAEALYRLGAVELRRRDAETWALWHDLRVLRDQLECLGGTNLRRGRVLRAFSRLLDVMAIESPDAVRSSAPQGRAAVAAVLAEEAGIAAHRVIAVGHAHIDSAWLWPYRETRRKVVRTYANALSLLSEYPEVTFATSSAQHLAWVEEADPDLFGQIRDAVQSGRFLLVGGMWVEADTMLPGGESMARQFVEGITWFVEHLGVTCEEVWLPDSFGYSGALPQIVRHAGARWFLTQKLSWNDTNRMPHHSFTWEGIDGSRVLVHFPPVDNYNSDLSPRQLAHAERNVASSDATSARLSMAPAGWGDGGGGPTREHAETARRLRDLAESPRVAWGTPAEFFTETQRLMADAAAGEPTPVWVGEMPLELHRGVSTTQQRTKAGNRHCEQLLREAELWCATATVRTGAPYPLAELRELWQTVLRHQFHDVLPGSSIAWVYDDVARDHHRVAARCEDVISRALAALVPAGEGHVLANAGPLPVDGVPALGSGRAPEDAPHVPPVTPVREGATWVLEDAATRLVVDAGGHVVALVDRASGRDAVGPAGPANAVELHRDLPNRWDAWDVDAHHARVVRGVPDADVRAEGHAVVVTRSFGSSRLTQRLTLAGGAVRVETEVDWHEREQLLILAFPLDLRADDVAAETQFGHVRRPTHTNTSWQTARFVHATHRWLHVAEGGVGIAVANRTTHGYGISRHVREDGGTTTRLEIHLLRGPRYPDPGADVGRHTFTHLLRPGATLGDAVADGYALALPLRRVAGRGEVAPLVRVSGQGVLAESVSLAHDGSGDVVVRLYEAHGCRADARVIVDVPGGRLSRTDLIGRPTSTDGSVACRLFTEDDRPGAQLTMRPFGLLTLRVARGAQDGAP